MFLILFVLSCICPLLSIPIIIRQFNRNRNTSFSLLIGVAAAAAIYGYVADRGNDIYRHIFNLRYYSDIPIYNAFDAGPLNAVYVWDIWQWIIAHLNNDYLLQSSGALVGFTIVFYMIFDYGKIKNINSKNITTVAIIALLTLSPLGFAIGIRSSNAFAICALAIYLYFVHNKHYLISLIIIITTIFLHHATIIIAAVWVLFPVFKKKPIFGALLIMIVMFTYTNYESYISMFMGGGSIFESMGSDLQKSVAEYTGTKVLSTHDFVTVIVQTVLLTTLFIRGNGLSVLASLKVSGTHIKEERGSINDFQFLMLVTIYMLLVLLSYNGNRYYALTLYLSLIPLMDSFQKRPLLRRKKVFIADLLIVALVCITFFITLHDMNWGTGSITSFIISLITGFLSRLLV